MDKIKILVFAPNQCQWDEASGQLSSGEFELTLVRTFAELRRLMDPHVDEADFESLLRARLADAGLRRDFNPSDRSSESKVPEHVETYNTLWKQCREVVITFPPFDVLFVGAMGGPGELLGGSTADLMRLLHVSRIKRLVIMAGSRSEYDQKGMTMIRLLHERVAPWYTSCKPDEFMLEFMYLHSCVPNAWRKALTLFNFE